MKNYAVHGLPEYFILKMYISGLKEEIQVDVVLAKPMDIHEAFEVSLMIEARKGTSKGLTYKPYSYRFAKSLTNIPHNKHEVMNEIVKTPLNETIPTN